jgi:hypothetical protein
MWTRKGTRIIVPLPSLVVQKTLSPSTVVRRAKRKGYCSGSNLLAYQNQRQTSAQDLGGNYDINKTTQSLDSVRHANPSI